MQQSVSKLDNLLRRWEEKMPTSNYNPIPTLNELCELFETELHNYFIKNKDPFNSRHAFRIDPNCVLAQMYWNLFHKVSFMNKLVMDYFPIQTKNNHNLNEAACRLIRNLIPGLEITLIIKNSGQLQNYQLIQRLFTWAEHTSEPFQTYATGFLASCMSFADIAVDFMEDNNKLVPIILDRLQSYYTLLCEENEINQNIQKYQNTNCDQSNYDSVAPSPKNKKKEKNLICGKNNSSSTHSNASNWKQIYSPDLISKLVYCLKFLVSTTECREFLKHAYEKNALNLVMKIINSSEKQNCYLTIEALKYLAALLFHKQFAIEFIGLQGLQKLLLIPKFSIPFTGLSICFYYLSNHEEAMEGICRLPELVLVDLVKYAFWMLECSHDSTRLFATKFFSKSFHYKVIQEIFDNHDGLRKLFNMVSTLPIFSPEHPANSSLIEDAECYVMKIIRHVCAGLKHYFEAHLHIKVWQIHGAKIRDSNLLISSTMNFFTVPGYKSMKKSRDKVQEDIELLSNAVSLQSHWTPIDQFFKLGGLSLLLKIVSLSREWKYSDCKGCEMIKNALEVLNICAVLPKVQLALCKIPSPKFPIDNQNYISAVEEDDPRGANDNIGLNIILKAAKGDLLDADIQKAALSIIITCVCAPIHREVTINTYYNSSYGSAKTLIPQTYDDAVIEKIWNCIRNNNGIMILLGLVTINKPITDVDAIRGLASRALVGLTRCESVRQIISKLPLFNSGELQSLMKNPVFQEKRQEHVTFRKYALELMELISGKIKSNGAENEASMANINRANVAAQTKINFDDQQLLFLMYQHLMTKGLSTTAESLKQEANFNVAEKKSTPFTCIFHHSNQSIETGISPISSRPTIRNQTFELANSSNCPLSAEFSARGINSTPIRLNVNRQSKICPKPEPEQELELALSNSVHKKFDQDLTVITDKNTNSEVSLESIVTEYLTNKHASCKHLMITCPQFDLFVPHKCPDPKPRSSMCTNFAMRFSKNIHSRKLNQRLIHSRFCPTRNFHMDDERAYFTCCDFLSQNRVVIGTDNGRIMVFNLFTSQVELSFAAYTSYIIDLQCSRDERILLSSVSCQMPFTSVWSITEDALNIKYSLDHEEYCTLSNYDQNKILGTKAEIATIYDLETSKRILTLIPRHSNQYSRNQAAFDATNELVLSDGVLWDAIGGKEIHKFDKLNQFASGIFHPNGLEIISNTEVWDMRTFQLLRTVASLDKCYVTFSKSGEGMYSYVYDQTIESDFCFQTSFKTLDPNDYSNIAIVDVQKSIYHLACNSSDTQIAIVENQETLENIEESIVQIYNVGRSRNEDEAVEKEVYEEVDSDDAN